jgi:plasmid maintenance system antidote protein VapI
MARRLIEAEGSCYELAEWAGLPRSVLTRFITGERGLTLESIDRLAGVLRLRLMKG